jgi:serine/threonine protein kinase
MDSSFYFPKKIISEGIFSRVLEIETTSVLEKFPKHMALKYVSSLFDVFLSPIEPFIGKLTHPNITKILFTEYDFEGSQMKMLLPLGTNNLSDIIRRMPPCLKKLRDWIRQIVLGLLHLHKNHFVHGDIKPSNIVFFKNDNLVKIIDFGFSVYIPSEDYLIYTSAFTMPYRAIEVWNKTGWSYSADIWSLGCTIFELAYRCFLCPIQHGTREEIKSFNLQVQEDFWSGKESIDHDIKYRQTFYPQEWFLPEMSEYNTFLKRILKKDNRPDIWSIANDPFLGLSCIIEITPYITKESLIEKITKKGCSEQIAQQIINQITKKNSIYHREAAEFCQKIEYDLF